jgi:hypothetical protein
MSVTRKHSERRQRRKLVAVRFTGEEYTVLATVARQSGKGMSTLLRESFFRLYARHP